MPTLSQKAADFVQSICPNAELAAALAQFDRWAGKRLELVLSADDASAGILWRGEGAAFTQAVLEWMRQQGWTEAACARYVRIADFVGHTGPFLKLTWLPDGSVRTSFYFFRRPTVAATLQLLRDSGVSTAVRDQLAALAKALEKRSVHFIAGTRAADGQWLWKLYFTQYLEAADSALGRILAAAEWSGLDTAMQARMRGFHESLAPRPNGETVFLSTTFSDAHVRPGLKIDFPGVEAGMLAAVAPAYAPAADAVRTFCARYKATRLDYLGIHFFNDRFPILKYYLDLHA